MEELKPCPFCGGKAKLYSGWDNGKELRKSYWAIVKCTQCGIVGKNCHNKGPIEDIELLTIESWNRRAYECDRKELLEVADEMFNDTTSFDITNVPENIPAWIVFKWQDRIRKALRVE